MLSLKAIQLLLRYFDGVDQALSNCLSRKIAWDEEALTFKFCDLMDEKTQIQEGFPYNLTHLNVNLEENSDPLGVSLIVETHKYDKHTEHNFTHSDVGLIIDYNNQFDQNTSFRSFWLLQAKRLFKDKSHFSNDYSLNSRFESIDKDQQSRIMKVNDYFGIEFIRYLLYCPRPKNLDRYLRENLNYLRNSSLASNIFDFSLGLQLKDDLLSREPTTEAGVFVSSVKNKPRNFEAVHRYIMRTATPLSWFIVKNIIDNTVRLKSLDEFDSFSQLEVRFEKKRIMEAIITGRRLDILNIDADNLILDNLSAVQTPAYTITVKIIQGIDRAGLN